MTSAAEKPFGLPPHAVRRLCEVFQDWPQIECVWIYGSRAKGTYRQGSDIDLCIQGRELQFTDLLRMETQIDDLLLPWKVDLSLMHQIDAPELLRHIQRVGQVFYSTRASG